MLMACLLLHTLTLPQLHIGMVGRSSADVCLLLHQRLGARCGVFQNLGVLQAPENAKKEREEERGRRKRWEVIQSHFLSPNLDFLAHFWPDTSRGFRCLSSNFITEPALFSSLLFSADTPSLAAAATQAADHCCCPCLVCSCFLSTEPVFMTAVSFLGN